MTLIVLNAAEGMLDMVAGSFDEPAPDCAQQWKAPTRGTEILAPALESLLLGLGKTVRDVRRWACVRGPGSFTGVRLVLSTVAAIRRISGAEVAGLEYMQGLACAGQRTAFSGVSFPPEGRLWVVTHARRDLVHFQSFRCHDSGIPVPLAAVDLCSPSVAVERVLASPQGGVLLGSGVARHREALQPVFDAVRVLDVSAPQAQDWWLLARHADYAFRDIEPLYVRPCDAVDNLDHIARKQGMEPEAAHARLRELLAAPPQPEHSAPRE